MGRRALHGAFGAQAVLGRSGRGAPGPSTGRPQVLDAGSGAGARSIKAAAGAGGLPARGCGRAGAGFDAGAGSWESRVWRPGAS